MFQRPVARILVVVSALLVSVALLRSIVIVDQTESVFVTEFGRPVRLIEQPGLHFKWPHQSARAFDRRLQLDTPPPREMLTRDKKNLEIAWYVSWRIADVERFLRTVRTLPDARARLEDMAASVLAAELGVHDLAGTGQRGRSLAARRDDERLDPAGGRPGGAGVWSGGRGRAAAAAELSGGGPLGGLRADPQRAPAGRRGHPCRGRKPGPRDQQRGRPRARRRHRRGRVRRRPHDRRGRGPGRPHRQRGPGRRPRASTSS